MKVPSVVQLSVASPRTGCSKSAHAAHGLGGETHLPSKPPHTLTRKGVVSSRDFHTNNIHASAVRVRNEGLSMSVSCHGHPLAVLRSRLADQGIVTARDLRRIPTNTRVRVTGLPVLVHTPPTKSGKRVMFITMEDETGLMDLVAFPKAQKDSARAIYTSQVLTLEGRLQRRGKRGLSISVVVDKVITRLSGALSDLLYSAIPKERAGRRKRETTEEECQFDRRRV